MTDDLTMYSALVSLAVPWLTDIVSRTAWSSFRRWLVFAVLSVIVSMGTVYFKGEWTTDDIVHSLLVVLIGASAAYQAWKPAVKAVGAVTG